MSVAASAAEIPMAVSAGAVTLPMTVSVEIAIVEIPKNYGKITYVGGIITVS